MDRPFADSRPLGPFVSGDNTGSLSTPVLRIVTREKPDHNKIASDLDDTDLSHRARSSIFRSLESNERSAGGYDTTMEISGLSHEQFMQLDSVIDNIGEDDAVTVIECK